MGGGTLARYFGWEAPREMNSRGLEGAHFQTGVDSTRVSRKRVLIFTFQYRVLFSESQAPSLKIKVYLNEGHNKRSLDISRTRCVVGTGREGQRKKRRTKCMAQG